MATPRQLARPPIKEALVDFRIAVDDAITSERLAPLCASLADAYSVPEVRRKLEAKFLVDGGKLSAPLPRDLGFGGMWLTSADKRRVAQFRTDGFTLNNVEEYVGGDALLAEAVDLWRRYAEVVSPGAITRLALRYVNRLELPLVPGDEFRKYLTAPPEMPDGAPQQVSDFLSRVVAHSTVGAVAIVTQKLDHAPEPPIPLVVDIDVFFRHEVSTDPRELRPLLEMLRDVKNQCFFSLLQEAAIQLYA